MTDRVTELRRHVTRIEEAVLNPVTVECQDCGAVLERPVKVGASELAAALRERRATLDAIAALEAPVAATVNPEDQKLADARDELAAFRDRKTGTDPDPPAARGGKPRRKSGRNRTS